MIAKRWEQHRRARQKREEAAAHGMLYSGEKEHPTAVTRPENARHGGARLLPLMWREAELARVLAGSVVVTPQASEWWLPRRRHL